MIRPKTVFYQVSSAWDGLVQIYPYRSLDKALGKFTAEVNDNVWDVVKLWKITPRKFWIFWSEDREVLMQQSHREIYQAKEEAEFAHV